MIKPVLEIHDFGHEQILLKVDKLRVREVRIPRGAINP
jgi:hypothetical protein